jgi:ABC-type polysaccharide/polyol phosphate transport system ATPase subunit
VLAATTTTTGSDQVAAENGLTLWEASKRFGSVQALDECSFSVERGRMLGFLGPNEARSLHRTVRPSDSPGF